MTLDFLDHLRFAQYHVQLRLLDPMDCHFFHGPALNGLLCTALHRHPLGPEIALHPMELGHIVYRAGESYPFALTLVGDDGALAPEIEAGLRAVGRDPPEQKTFGRFEVVSIARQPTPVPLDLLNKTIKLQFVTPLRMERQEGAKGRRFLDPGYFAADRFLRLLHDRVYDLAKLSSATLPAYEVPDLPEMTVTDTSLIWIDAPYSGRKKTFGGVVGRVTLNGALPEAWQRLLDLGQYLGVGRNTALGFGCYEIDPQPGLSRVSKTRSFLDLALAPTNLVEAFHHVKLNRGQPGADEQSIDAFGDRLFVNLEELTAEFKEGRYQASPLTGIVLPKPLGKIRALAVPTVRDRVAQRAVTQVLGPAFDLLLEESSFAYRKGLSRAGAAQAIARAHAEGFRYILESDVEAFFDNVDWQLMEGKLRALLPGDRIIELIMDWVTQDVLFEGQRLKRTRGLPQGAVVSPLLSNLYLDEFDEALLEDFRLIRYADDFVVLCKSRERAEAALEEARAALEPLALQIKPAKTRIVDFQQGFQYLGYIFCRSTIVEAKKETPTEGPLPAHALTPDQIPTNHWLTHCDLSALKKLKPPAARPPGSLAVERDMSKEERFPVYLTDPDILARLSGQSLILSRHGRGAGEDVKIPFQKILAVIDYGRPSMTLPAVVGLGQAHIPTFFQDHSGRTTLAVPAGLPDYALWTRQMAFRERPGPLLRFARAVVRAKINNYRVLCLRRDWHGALIESLKDLEDQAARAETIDSLRGYEGRAAALYFQGLVDRVPTVWNFRGRRKHPPTDPINALLSLGYSCLYHHVATALQICGLNPTVGWYHEPRNDYSALACDLQEEFRHLVDGLVLTLLNRKRVAPEDFKTGQTGPLPVLMTQALRRRFLAEMEERMLTEFKPERDGDAALTYRAFFLRQARQIVTLCAHPEQEYVPLRIH